MRRSGKKTAAVVALILCVCLLTVSVGIYGNRRPSQFCYSVDEGERVVYPVSLQEENTVLWLYRFQDEKWRYRDFPRQSGIEPQDSWECITEYPLSDTCAIISYKHYDGRAYHLRRHIEDQLVYLDDERQEAQLLYRSRKGERILYGDARTVLVYRSDTDRLQSLRLSDGSMIHEESAGLARRWTNGACVYSPADETLTFSRMSLFGVEKPIKTVSLDTFLSPAD